MSQLAERERVKARIKALTERTVERGCTEAEALAAAEMVGRLLERYALTMAEIDMRQEPCVQIHVKLAGQRRRPIDLCVPALARFCDCKVWLAREADQSVYVFFGFATDATLAAYLYEVIERAIATELAAFRAMQDGLNGAELRRALLSFQQGMALRVSERLAAMHSEREKSVAAQMSAGRALLIVRDQVVEEAFRATKVRLQSLPGLSLRRNSAFKSGRNAGEKVNLRRPLDETGPKPRLR